MILQSWSAGGHELQGMWLSLAGRAAAGVLAFAFAALLLRALLRRRRYRATGVLGEADLRAIHDALAAVERRTVGEVLPVVLERSDPHPGARWLAALSVALAGSVGLAPWLPWDRPALLLLAQVGLGLLGAACARLLPDFQRFFVSEARARALAEEQAFQEFHRYQLHTTEARTGVLLFVSLLERRAIVLADQGIAARVGPEHWAETNDLVLAGIRRGSLREGLLAGIRSAGEVLARDFPVEDGDRNEIPDRVIVRRE